MMWQHWWGTNLMGRGSRTSVRCPQREGTFATAGLAEAQPLAEPLGKTHRFSDDQ
jgi:hypothetical protein